MRSDAQLSLIGLGAPLSLVGAAASTPSPGIIDLIGSGVGQPPGNVIGNKTTFGTDMGIGSHRVELEVATGLAFVGGTSLNVALQAAPDQGVAGAYQPGTWQTIIETGAMTTAQLTAAINVARFPFVPAFPAGLNPRYMRLLFTTIGTFTQGTIAFALIVPIRDDFGQKYAARNYSVA